jgi:hypothetical protein
MPADVTKTPVPVAITTPSRVEAAIGTPDFTDGYPTGETAERLRNHLDYLHGVETFMNTIQGCRRTPFGRVSWTPASTTAMS